VQPALSLAFATHILKDKRLSFGIAITEHYIRDQLLEAWVVLGEVARQIARLIWP
jgi:hypothetical protein